MLPPPPASYGRRIRDAALLTRRSPPCRKAKGELPIEEPGLSPVGLIPAGLIEGLPVTSSSAVTFDGDGAPRVQSVRAARGTSGDAADWWLSDCVCDNGPVGDIISLAERGERGGAIHPGNAPWTGACEYVSFVSRPEARRTGGESWT